MTNNEKINAMSVEEKAEFLCVNIDCDKCFLNQFCGTECREETYCCSVFEKWLESEVEE